MHTSGGRVTITVNGINYSARGAIKLNPSNISVAAGVNQDATLYRTVAPKARSAQCTFDRFVSQQDGTKLVWNEDVLKMTDMQVTFVESDGGLTHILTGAFFVGDPDMDTSTGEIDGLSIAADRSSEGGGGGVERGGHMTTTITLIDPIEGAKEGELITEIILRKPKFADVMALGEPKAYAHSEGGLLYTAEKEEVISGYIKRLLESPKNPDFLLQLGMADTLQLKEAIYDFFRDAREAISKRSSTA